VTYYSPPSYSPPTVVREIIVIRENGNTGASGFGNFLAGLGGALTGLAAIVTLANSNNNSAPAAQRYQQQYSRPVQQYSPPVQRYIPPPRQCWYEPRQEYLGRFFDYREEWPVYDQYGRLRGVRWRNHYVNRYRTYQVRVCE
jgi:hypothetical protein